MKLFSITLLLTVGFCSTAEIPQRKSYDGYKVLDIIPQDQQTVDYLRQLMLNDDSLDFWTEPSYVGKLVQLMISPDRLSHITRQLENHDIRFTTFRENVQDVLEPMWREIDSRSGRRVFDIDDFNTFDDINLWMSTLAAVCRTGFTCEVVNLGNSFENRPINSFRLSKSGESDRRTIYLDSTIHAREWISTATSLKILDNLVRGTTAEALRMVDKYDWVVIPVINPDGYVYTWTSDRYWRKNRRPVGACFGTDLNRNFNVKWGTDGVSHSPCSITFCGPSPASEPEIQAVQAEMHRLSSSAKALITLHSKGQMWMFSWGTTVNHAGSVCERSDDHDDMMVVTDLAADATQRTYGTVWTRGNSCETIYATSGSTMDYGKAGAGIKYTFTLELRGEDWVIDKVYIPMSYLEVWNGVVALVDSMP